MVLFAALSYAVTQSSRGGGNAKAETSKIEIAEYSQAVTSLRTATQRMRLKGVGINDIEFCAGGFPICGAINNKCTTGENCIYAKEGGGLDGSFLKRRAFTLYPPDQGVRVAGHGSLNIVLLSTAISAGGGLITIEQCEAFNESFGYSPTIYADNTPGTIYGDSTPLEGRWDFCYDDGGFYIIMHLLATN
ncbi:MAG: hypothetical protein JKY22_00225 [Flavobacteriaceae bacterium]|nr:hypothetical protein [Flavobacteriaceae bacterium]